MTHGGRTALTRLYAFWLIGQLLFVDIHNLDSQLLPDPSACKVKLSLRCRLAPCDVAVRFKCLKARSRAVVRRGY